MQKINSEILERKITFLFFENPKRTFNVKQIKYFIGAKINDQEFFKILLPLFLILFQHDHLTTVCSYLNFNC